MPVKTRLWTVSDIPVPLVETKLVSEKQLEEMIVREPRLLADEWMLIGRQQATASGGIIDLLAVAPDGALVLIEIKRDRTPREVVAQTIDYAEWVQDLDSENLVRIYNKFKPGANLARDFHERFGRPLDEDELNSSHQIIIVAAELEPSSERIVGYLNQRGISINVLFFQVFSVEGREILSRTWLLDPVETQSPPSANTKRESEPWNGEFYASFGQDANRSWDEAVKYGFISAGGGAWYTRTLQPLAPGDRVWVKVPRTGFVGVGRVTGHAQAARDFKIRGPIGPVPALEILTEGEYLRQIVDDDEMCEYFVPIDWLETRRLDQAVNSIGMFGNQSTVCKPTSGKWRSTVEALKSEFPGHAAVD